VVKILKDDDASPSTPQMQASYPCDTLVNHYMTALTPLKRGVTQTVTAIYTILLYQSVSTFLAT